MAIAKTVHSVVIAVTAVAVALVEIVAEPVVVVVVANVVSVVAQVRVRVVKVRDLDEAQRLRFHGSPSVVIDGVDIEGPAVAERPTSYG